MLDQIQFGKAFSMLMRTLPILGLRLGAHIVFWVVMIIYFAVLAGIAALLSRLNETLGVIVFFIGFIALWPLYNLAYQYVFFMLKAAHIAVLSELLLNNKVPDGMGQFEYGKQQVETRFGEINIMFVIDQLVNGAVGAFTGTISWLTSWLPGETLQTLVGMVNTVVRIAVGYVDEAVLARAFWRKDQSIWTSAVDGVVLYAQVWKPILINSVALMVLSYIPFFIILLLFSAPTAFLTSLINQDLAAWSIVVTFVLAWLFKVSIGDTFAIAAIMATYFKETQNLAPDPQMQEQVAKVSDKFRELQQRAMQALGNQVPMPPQYPQTGVR